MTAAAALPVAETDPLRMRDAILSLRRAGRRVGFVPTMGALHAGHASLVARAAAECDDVVVSIFVNPTQFSPQEDFSRYPRSLEADCRLVAQSGAGLVFAPHAATAYPPGHATSIVVAGPTADFEGRIRPGHFSGVATVVCWLVNVVPADIAYFGAKDWQQTVVVRRMVADLALPIRIEVCPTVREEDGLAMSSRNGYLSAADRLRAGALYASLLLAASRWDAGESVATIEAAMEEVLVARGVNVDYARLVEPETLLPPRPGAGVVALVAGKLGTTRLIDNLLLPARP